MSVFNSHMFIDCNENRENNLRNKVNANPSIVTILSVFVNITLTHDPVSFVVLLNFVLINDIYSVSSKVIFT